MAANSTNPYPGPRPFTAEEYAIFAGRDHEIAELSSLIVAHRAVLLYARSGAGKSSLLNAGLRPALTEKGVVVLPTARVGIPPREAVPLEGLRNVYTYSALRDLLPDVGADEAFVRRATLAEGLARMPAAVDEDGDARLRLIAFDQFEELFSAFPERWPERREFFSEVNEALQGDASLRVLFLQREDYLADFNELAVALSDGGRTRYRLDPLREAEALAAVLRPLEGRRWRFATGVAEALVKDLSAVKAAPSAGGVVAGEFVEPIQLQVVCYELLERLPPESNEITSDHVREFGGADEALRRFYDRAVGTAVRETRVDERDVRSWFRTELITPAATRGLVFQDVAATGGIPNEVVAVLEREHLIRAELRSGFRWFELTHDRLVQPILNSNRDFLLRVKTEEAAAEGERMGRIRQADPTRSDSAGMEDTDSAMGSWDSAGVLCLSGGGYRSVLYHAGALMRLNELGVLPRVSYAAVSAGSIVAAKLGLEWARLEFDASGVSRGLLQRVVEPLLAFTRVTIDDASSILSGFVLPGRAVDRVVDQYQGLLYGEATLQDLPDAPNFALNATNVQTGSLWKFSKAYMSDYRVGRIDQPAVKLSVAVASSAAIPPVLSPVVLNLKDSPWTDTGNRGDLSGPEYREHVVLTDGRLYDPLALESVWQRYETILVSDGGVPLSPQAEPKSDWARHSYRLFDVLDSQVRVLRRRQLTDAYELGIKRGAYWNIATHRGAEALTDALAVNEERMKELAQIPGRLQALTPEVQRRLINWGYASCDAAYRRFVAADAFPPAGFPFPEEGV